MLKRGAPDAYIRFSYRGYAAQTLPSGDRCAVLAIKRATVEDGNKISVTDWRRPSV